MPLPSRSSSREVTIIRVPFFSVVYSSRGTLLKKGYKGTTGGPSHSFDVDFGFIRRTPLAKEPRKVEPLIGPDESEPNIHGCSALDSLGQCPSKNKSTLFGSPRN